MRGTQQSALAVAGGHANEMHCWGCVCADKLTAVPSVTWRSDFYLFIYPPSGKRPPKLSRRLPGFAIAGIGRGVSASGFSSSCVWNRAWRRRPWIRSAPALANPGECGGSGEVLIPVPRACCGGVWLAADSFIPSSRASTMHLRQEMTSPFVFNDETTFELRQQH